MVLTMCSTPDAQSPSMEEVNEEYDNSDMGEEIRGSEPSERGSEETYRPFFLDESKLSNDIDYDEDNFEDDNESNNDAERDLEDGEVLDGDVVRKMIFDSVEDAEKFYIAYANVAGFDVRREAVKMKLMKQKKDETNLEEKGGKPIRIVKMREWVCSSHGFRRKPKPGYVRMRRPKPETRFGCKACFRVSLDRFSGLYKVSRFIQPHNHPLETQSTSHRLRSNRYLTPSHKSLLTLMTDGGFKPSMVTNFLEQLEGGAGKLSFKRKAGYNWLNKQRREMIRGGDVNTALQLLEGLRLNDPDIYYKFTVDCNGALTRLFWCDGMSRVEFDLFGDVLVFDSTYKTNAYRFPLVIFSGVNSHCSTCVFGAAVLYKETTESYRWLLSKFREAMKGKTPKFVLTDQDYAMRAAILAEFPDATHKLCSWHLARNVANNIRDNDFKYRFGCLVKRPFSVEEFEENWANLIDLYDISHKSWVMELYEKRNLWAEACFRGQFTIGMRTTQRSESMNALMKLSLSQKLSLTEFMKHYHRALQRIRSVFFELQENSEKTRPVVNEGPLKNLEQHAASICTQQIFYAIQIEISNEQGLVVESLKQTGNQIHELSFGEYNSAVGHRYDVSVDLQEGKFHCSCLFLESFGFPCSHIIGALKKLRQKKFPKGSINPRWLIDTGKKLRIAFPAPFLGEDKQRSRFAQMNKECLNLCFLSSQSDKKFNLSMRKVEEATKIVEEQSTMPSDVLKEEDSIASDNSEFGMGVEPCNPPSQSSFRPNIRDPNKIQPKGGVRSRQQKCSKCGVPGHKANTCTMNGKQNLNERKNRRSGLARSGEGRAQINGDHGKKFQQTENCVPVEKATVERMCQSIGIYSEHPQMVKKKAGGDGICSPKDKAS